MNTLIPSRRSVLAALVAFAIAAPAASRPLMQYDDLAIAPQGDRVVTIDHADEPDAASSTHAVLVVRATTGGRVLARIDPCHACSYSDPAYAADGRLAFIARDGALSYLMLAGAGTARRLASIRGLAARPRWSPDGRSIALLITEQPQKETGATRPGARQVGEIGTRNDVQRIAIVPATGGSPRLVSPPDRFIYEYEWTPDGRGFVATSATGNGDANWWVATIDAVDLASGGVRAIAKPTTQANFPRVSPDGRTVAFIGGLMSDFGSVGGDVWTVPFAGGAPVDRTPGYRGSFTSLLWGRGGLRATALIGDKAAAVPIDPASGAARPVWSAPVAIAASDARIAFADTGAMATVIQDFAHPPVILAGPPAAPAPITHENDGYAPIVTARSLVWSNDGLTSQGWLLAPAAATAGTGGQPMVTSVHGGPAAAAVPQFLWQGTLAAVARGGYWIFMPNPRGSYGQGEAFTMANRRDFGGGDLHDILAGIDAAEQVAPVDDGKLGLIGGSYGGFMGMWANTQTTRFKAIVASAGISDWISYYGTNGINSWMIPYLGKTAYDDPQPYWAMSAIRTIKTARTPTLITVGERDIEVPPGQSLEYWNALKTMGVPTTLVIYQDEGHGVRQADHAADLRQRTVQWLDRYLKGVQTQ